MVASEPGVIVKVTALLVTPPEDAVMDVVPARTPVARPSLLMVATPVELLFQVKVTPLSVVPLLFLATAENWLVPPTAIDEEAAVIVIDATVVLVPELEELPLHPVKRVETSRPSVTRSG
jgi:hypothetical protein